MTIGFRDNRVETTWPTVDEVREVILRTAHKFFLQGDAVNRYASHVDVDVSPENWADTDGRYHLMARAVHRWVDCAPAEWIRNDVAKRDPPTALNMSCHMAVTVSISKPRVTLRMMLTEKHTGADVIAFQEWARAGIEAEIAGIPSDAVSEHGKANREQREAQ